MALYTMCVRSQRPNKYYHDFLNLNNVLKRSKYPRLQIAEKRIMCSGRRSGKSMITDLFNPKQPKYFYKLDGLDRKDEFELAYFSSSHQYIKWGIVFGYAMTLPTWIVTGRLLFDSEFRDNFQSSFFIETLQDLMGLTISSWLLIGFIVVSIYKFPLRIYYSQKSEKFVFVFHRLLPYVKNTLECSEGQMTQVDRYKFLGDYRVPGRRIYLSPGNFRVPEYYNILLGYSRKNKD